MMKNYRVFLFLLFLFGSSNAWTELQAQNISETDRSLVLPREQVVVFTDRDLYLAGEKVWFSAFCWHDGGMAKKDWSRVLYLEVHDEKGQSFIREKWAIQEGLASGFLALPVTLPSGNYFLRGYTRYQQNQALAFFYTRQLQVIQPEQALPPVSPGKTLVSPSTSKKHSPIPIQLSTDKPVYAPRALIQLELMAKETLLQSEVIVSVAVVKKGTANLEEPEWSEAIPVNKDYLEILPELRGMTINGLVRDKTTGLPLADVSCAIGVLEHQQEVHFATTKADGSFVFTLDQFWDERNLFLGIQEEESDNKELLIQNDFSTNFPTLQRKPLTIDSTQRKLIEEMYVNYQVQTNFSNEIDIWAIRNRVNNYSDYFAPPTIRRDLSSFIEVPAMEEVFNELVPSVFVKRQKGKIQLTLVDGITKEVYTDPLVLLDGVPVSDLEALLALNPEQIKSVNLLDRKYVFGDKILNGVIFVQTKLSDFAGMVWPQNATFITYQGLKPELVFLSPNYKMEDIESHDPDFRTLLYWNPNAVCNQQKSVLQFYASDHCSEYEVIVKGITSDGQSCMGKMDFKVEKPQH